MTENDAARQRREARRRKILSSGENRLNKIVNTFSGKPTEPTPISQPETSTAVNTTSTIDSSRDSHHEAASTPKSSDLGRSSANSVQSPSHARTPSDSPADFGGREPTVPTIPPWLMENIGKTGELDSTETEQYNLMSEQLKALSQFNIPEPDGSVMQPATPVAAASPVPRAIGFLRFISMVLLALFAAWTILQTSEFAEPNVEDEDDSGPWWKNYVRNLNSVSSHAGYDIEVSSSVWVLFLSAELAWQSVLYFYRMSGRGSSNALPEALQMLGQMGFRTSGIDTVFKTINNYRTIWQSLLEDLFTFIAATGLIFGVAQLLDETSSSA
ncbi:hypothetical protein DFS34DRAFT_26037 [Phlyctochytrium arcticum]|nr:hypothetical protein DFS34DRAFT_26037 [Phlyctochytrium arcticum]